MKSSFTLSKRAKLSDAIAAIEAGGKQIALVLSGSGKLLGVVTDGDIRRALLGGATMEAQKKADTKFFEFRDKYMRRLSSPTISVPAARP